MSASRARFRPAAPSWHEDLSEAATPFQRASARRGSCPYQFFFRSWSLTAKANASPVDREDHRQGQQAAEHQGHAGNAPPRRLGAAVLGVIFSAHLLFAYAARSRSSLSKPSCTICIWSGGYSRASARACSGDPLSHVSNSSSRVSSTGMRS
jgi:hypothetical protein